MNNKNISKPLPKPWNLTLEPLSLEFNDLQKNHNHFQTGGQNLEIWPWSRQAWKWKICEGISYENDQFQAAGLNMEI